jgi:hypothetical protein
MAFDDEEEPGRFPSQPFSPAHFVRSHSAVAVITEFGPALRQKRGQVN